jgi:hypothetical protein
VCCERWGILNVGIGSGSACCVSCYLDGRYYLCIHVADIAEVAEVADVTEVFVTFGGFYYGFLVSIAHLMN